MTYPISVIVPAAGLSRRMGAVNKLLLDIDGMTMVRRSVQLYCSLFTSVTVVTGFESAKVEDALVGLDVRCVFNPDFETGQQSSVSCGMDSLPLNGEGVLIALADQPYLTQDDIRTYVEAFLQGTKDKIFVPYFNGARGNPVLFPTQLVKHMEAQAVTCREFIDSHPDLVAAYAASNSHFIFDIDTPDDVPESAGHDVCSRLEAEKHV